MKLRVWNKLTKEMLYDGFKIDADGDVFLLDYDGEHLCEPEDVIVMRGVNLQDKNGKEIYEKDLISCFPRDNAEGSSKDIREIEYDNWNCGCCDNIYGFSGFGYDKNDDIFVVGNSLENPELKND